MTTGELVADLAPVRISETFAGFGIRDAPAAIAPGLIAALVIARLLGAVAARRARPVDHARAGIAPLDGCAMPLRIANLTALLRANGATIPDAVSRALYDPDATFDPAALERTVIAAARRRPCA